MNRLRCLLFAIVVLSSATFALGGEIQFQAKGIRHQLCEQPTRQPMALPSDIDKSRRLGGAGSDDDQFLELLLIL